MSEHIIKSLLAVFYLALVIVEQLPEALEMHHLALAKEFNYLVDIGIVRHTENIVIGRSRLLLRRQVLNQIGYRVGFGLQIRRRERNARSICGIDRVAVIDIIRARTVLVKAPRTLAVGKLTDYAADYLKMRQFVCTLMLSIKLYSLLLLCGKFPYDFFHNLPVGFRDNIAIITPVNDNFCHLFQFIF